MYTHGYNKTIRSLIGNFPKQEGKNEDYKRARVFRNSLIRTMKPTTTNLRVYRGLSGENAKKFKNMIKSGKNYYNTNAFSSFTTKAAIASMFAKGDKFFASKEDVVLVMEKPKNVPVINYNRGGFHSKYPIEKEILFPPGRFTVISKNGMGYYKVKFEPKKVKVGNTKRLEQIGETIHKRVPRNNQRNLMNIEWRNRAGRIERTNEKNLKEIQKFRNHMMKSNVPKNVLKFYSKENPYFRYSPWHEILKAYSTFGDHKNLPILKPGSKFVTKKLVQQIIAHSWSKMNENKRKRVPTTQQEFLYSFRR